MKYALIMLTIVAWTIGWPVFAWYSWGYPQSFAAFDNWDWTVLAIDTVVFVWILNDLANWFRRA